MANGITVGIVLTFIMLSGAFLLTVLINILLVPIIKTPRKVISEIIDAMNLKKDDSFVDLGCGDGKVVLEAYTNAKCKCYGLDLSPIMIILARTLRILKYPANKDIVFEVENIYEVSLKDFTKIYCYLDTKSMGILKKKLQKFIKDGGEVFSYKYGIKGMKGERKVKLSNGEYLYIYS